MKMNLHKTNIKGLFLTTNGKAWRKDLKIEIKPTGNGKIRFNGKLYDLQKLIELNGQKTPINKVSKPKQSNKKLFSIRELKKQGFKKTKISGLYITNKGLCYNAVTKRNLAITQGKTTVNGKVYNVAKIILETFCKIPIRSGQISFLNGNNKDFSFENLQYKSTSKETPPVGADLINCIRLYFEIDKNQNLKSLITKYYLYEIIKMRGFNLRHNGIDFDLFIEYVKPDFWILSNNQNDTFEKFNYTTTNGKNAINKYLNLLVIECLKDFEKGILKVKNFKTKPPTKTQKLKELQTSINEKGLNIKIPLRKPSIKETLNKYLKQTNDLRND